MTSSSSKLDLARRYRISKATPFASAGHQMAVPAGSSPLAVIARLSPHLCSLVLSAMNCVSKPACDLDDFCGRRIFTLEDLQNILGQTRTVPLPSQVFAGCFLLNRQS